MGEPTAERGGHLKLLFTVTVAGSRMVHQVQDVRNQLWNKIASRGLPSLSESG